MMNPKWLIVLVSLVMMCPLHAKSIREKQEEVRQQLLAEERTKMAEEDAAAREILGSGMPERENYKDTVEWSKALNEYALAKLKSLYGEDKSCSYISCYSYSCIMKYSYDDPAYDICKENVSKIQWAVDKLVRNRMTQQYYELEKKTDEYRRKHNIKKKEPSATVYCDSLGRCEVYIWD